MSEPLADERHSVVFDVPFTPEPRHLGRFALRVAGFGLTGIVSVFVLLFVLLLAADIFGSIATSVSVASVTVLIIIAVHFSQRSHERNRLEQLFEQHAGLDPAAMLERLLHEFHRRKPQPGRAIAWFIDTLVREEVCPNLTFRAGPLDSLEPIVPITAPFELRPLNDSDPSFDALRRILPADGDGDAAERDYEARFERRRFWSSVIPWIVWPPVLFFIALSLWNGDYGPVVPGLTVGAAFWVWWILRGVYRMSACPTEVDPRTATWLLAPGGVVLISPRIAKARWNVRVVDSKRAVLVTYPADHKLRRWHLVIADDRGQVSRVVSRIELTLFLSAWTSPLRPPPVERLSDYTGGKADE